MATIDTDWEKFTAVNGTLDASMLRHSPGGIDMDVSKVILGAGEYNGPKWWHRMMMTCVRMSG
jgi:hypothetical protein